MSTKNNILTKFATSASKSDVFYALLITIAWQLSVCFMSLLAAHIFTGSDGEMAVHRSTTFLGYIFNWDGLWYKGIVEGSYANIDNPSPVFFPLFPGLVWIVDKLTLGLLPLSIPVLFINTSLTAISVLFLKRISSILLPKINSWIIPILFLLSPAAIFLHMAYTEALLTAVAVSSYYFALRRKWVICCIILSFGTAAKLAALLFVGLCFLEFLKSKKWSIKNSFKDKGIFFFLLTPLGFVVYSLILLIVRGDPLAMINSVGPWSYHKLNPNIFETLIESTGHVIAALTPHATFDHIVFVNFLLPLLALAALAASSVYVYVKLKNIPLAIFGAVSFIFFLLNSNVVSVHRYLLPIFVIYIALAHALTHAQPLLKITLGALVYTDVLLQGLLIVLFVTYNFAG